jgi:hypothetical protein
MEQLTKEQIEYVITEYLRYLMFHTKMRIEDFKFDVHDSIQDCIQRGYCQVGRIEKAEAVAEAGRNKWIEYFKNNGNQSKL